MFPPPQTVYRRNWVAVPECEQVAVPCASKLADLQPLIADFATETMEAKVVRDNSQTNYADFKSEFVARFESDQ